ncbi:hypothetical protein HPSH_04950 [Helicobacter pylori Shi470]|nr:hypothetical protein HPSH_04950 [Helicobacter pylori Shi470]
MQNFYFALECAKNKIGLIKK